MSERLLLDAPIASIDAKLAERRAGFRTKGPPAKEVLAEDLDIRTVGDLLRHYPRRYIDRSATVCIRDLRIGQEVTVIARVSKVNARRTRQGRPLVSVSLFDGTGYLELTFFNQPWIASQYRKGTELAVSGRAELYRGRLQLANQEVEVLRGGDGETVHTGRVTPVHGAADGITTRTIRELVHAAIQRLATVADPLPAEIRAEEGLIDQDRALRWIHFPDDDDALRAATDRLKFDELFTLELGVAYRKRRLERTATGVAHQADMALAVRFVEDLPFEPTGAQRRAMKEIAGDMAAARPMNRLLQGDVGSGKTAVALHAAVIAIGSGHQATIMSPTEVLAGQHLESVAVLLAPLGGRDLLLTEGEPTASRRIPPGQESLFVGGTPSAPREDASAGGHAPLTYALLSASVTGRDRQRVLDGVRDGTVDLVVGTHALVQEAVEFSDLSLAVIDEQHRFGVHQRITLKEKGARPGGGQPDVLIMTATPIPRTLALTYYGDLDVSVLDELPVGRQAVETQVAHTAGERSLAYELVREEVAAGQQAFVVCAAIDEGNRLEVKAAEAEAARLASEVFPELRIERLHGRMRPTEKQAVMEAFRMGRTDVLISTTVIEVGVDVPNATVMLVENAERFGLAQLHQLRGRIGRGAHRSHCVLFDGSRSDNQEARARLEAMVRTTDGFALADEDLRLRGEGTLFDIRQSGLPDLKLARLSEDAELVARARTRAFAVIDDDPALRAHPELEDLLRRTFRGDAIDWLFHG